ncbi:MAG TPA: HNH endonuclease [Planktothrix sp.]|jgi:hypothetical protein
MDINEIVSYIEMCKREHLSLQKGMNFNAGRGYSIVLMSRQPNAPYKDEVRNSGCVLIYEGHDIPRSAGIDPKTIDQQANLRSGKLTENGKFQKASDDFKSGVRPAEIVRVYEKIRDGIWSYNGAFDLTDCWIATSGSRQVFKFELKLREHQIEVGSSSTQPFEHTRLIPTQVKLEVWKRDNGKCVECGSSDHLHFDHLIPFSKGGASITAANVQLLCARHNLEKSDSIR